MPKRKDPDIPVRQVAVVTPWPGQSAERVEQLVTRKVEERVAQNIRVSEITSTSRSGLSVVYAEVDEMARIDTGKEFDDIKVKLDALTDLPEGAGPIQYIKEFGETSALMLTVASPPASGVQLQLLASQIATAAPPQPTSTDVLLCSSGTPDPSFLHEAGELLGDALIRQGLGSDLQTISGGNFVVLRMSPRREVSNWADAVQRVWEELPQGADIHPDVWDPIVVASGGNVIDALRRHAGPKYSYRELDDFTDRIEKAIRIAPEASRVTRVGVIEEQIEARYSQNRLAALGIVPAALGGILRNRNTTFPAGTVNAGGRDLALEQSGEFRTLADIDTAVFTLAANGTPIYLRDIGSVHRGYQHPARFLSYYTWRAPNGDWQRGRAITLSTEMKKGEQIDRFGTAVGARVEAIRQSLPADLVIGTTSDQKRQVREKLDLFNRSLWEAVALVVLVSFVGFWEWRSALLMALSIPITLAMTFGLMELVGLDIQQMSIAALIIALGLLVDDPVVAGDAIKRELSQGKPRSIAAWLGPDKLSKAILYATITNIAAYLPFLLLKGDVGRYIYSLPVTIACSLIASRVMSMTFLPLLAFYILKPEAASAEQSRETSIRHDGTGVQSASRSTIGGRCWPRLRSCSSPADFSRPTFVSSSFPETTSILRMSIFACRKTRPWLRRCELPEKPTRSFATSLASSTDRIHSLPKALRFSPRSRRSSVQADRGSGFPCRRSHRRPTTRSSCCNSLEAKTRTRSWVRFKKRSPRASPARESTSERLKPDRRH